jgi:cytochrome c oxidase cbb3-type subunit 3
VRVHRAILRALTVLAALAGAACERSPGRPRPDQIVLPPDEVMDSALLYAKNCAGCHGIDGKGGPSIPLGDPLYLAIADDVAIRKTAANGVPGTPMPAFAKSAGGMLADAQIDTIVGRIRSWAQPEAFANARLPSHVARGPGHPKHGADVYAEYCSRCHGPDGTGGAEASSIVDGSYLALVSDQDLRTNVIVGRPAMGAPTFRDNVPGKPMSNEEVTDVVAWLAAQRSRFPGQPYPGAQSDRSMGELP